MEVVDFVDDLDFDEMVACSECAALAFATLVGAGGEGVGVGVGEATAGFGVIKIGGDAEAFLDDVGGTLGEQVSLLGDVELDFPGSAYSAGDVGEERSGELGDAVLEILGEEIGVEKSDAAVDVVADTARGDDAVLVGVGGSDTADAESVAPVDVGHGEGGRLDAGQKSDVSDLFGGAVGEDAGQESGVGEDDSVDTHAGLVAAGDTVTVGVDLLDGSVPVVGHVGLRLDVEEDVCCPKGADFFDFEVVIGDGLDFCIQLVASVVNGLAEGCGPDVVGVKLGYVETAEEHSLGSR